MRTKPDHGTLLVTSRRATAIGTGTGTAAATAAGKQRQALREKLASRAGLGGLKAWVGADLFCRWVRHRPGG